MASPGGDGGLATPASSALGIQAVGGAWIREHGRGKLAPERREELRGALLRDFQAQAADAAALGVAGEGVVEREIRAFLDNGRVSEGNLDRLRRRVARATRQEGGASAGSVGAGGSCASGYSRPTTAASSLLGSGMRVMSARGASDAAAALGGGGLGVAGGASASASGSRCASRLAASGSASARGPPRRSSEEECRWSALAQLQKLIGEQEETEKQRSTRRRQEEVKDYLERQMREKQEAKLRSQEERRRIREAHEADARRQQEEELAKKQEERRRVLEIKQDRDQQVAAVQKARAEETAQKNLYAQACIEKATRELEDEQRKQAARKAREWDMMARLASDWQKEKEERDEELRKLQAAEREESLRCRAELEQERLQQRAAVQRALEDRDVELARLRGDEQRAKEEKLKAREEKLQEEALMLEQVNQAAKEAKEQENAKIKARRAATQRNAEFLFSQMEEKHKLRCQSRERQVELKEQAASEYASHVESEHQKRHEQRMKNIQHKRELQLQIDSRQVLPKALREDLMSNEEALRNRKLLREHQVRLNS
eukprot:TRINITY_DN55857_c0_g1_i1.p1 TRINITY_DN55857_c0_g1~~TRINITY_DN55857_c0_g1_i1.p1  ORF type:complete len:548 (-),score=177.53 TRINITY_DN55857_c0_g1_i1:38-1681(-)